MLCVSCGRALDALGTEHGRRLSRVGQRDWLLYAMARTDHLRRFRCLIAAGGPIVQFTSLDSAGGPGGRGAGMTVAVVEPSHTTWVELAGRRVMPSPGPPMMPARAADPEGGSLPVVCRGPATFTVRPIGPAAARLTTLGRRGVHRDDTRLSRRLSCLADREPRTQHPGAIFIQPISHPHRWPPAPLRRDGQGGNVVPPSGSTGEADAASDRPRAGETAALTFRRRLGGIQADRCTGSHG